jgi:large subunit ribosomal protein L5
MEMSRLKQRYLEEIRPAMMERFNYKNIHQVPRIEKVVINMGVGEGKDNPKVLDAAVHDLTLISGQKPIVTKARKSVASFKVREGMSIGCKVTLRGVRMYDFLDKLFNVALPRVRDFRGMSPRSFDGRGNYTIGIREQLIFPEIDYSKVEKIMGMDIVIVTTAETDEEARELLRLMGAPFRAA